MMTSASMVAMPIIRSVPPPAAVAFPASSARARRNVRFSIRSAAASSGGGGDDQPPPSMAAVPASLRAIQAKRKVAVAAPRAAGGASAAECAVAALVRAVQGAAAGGARGAGDAVAWVVSKVHDFQASSPDLAVSGLLGMLASCLGPAVEVEAERARVMTAQAKKPDDEEVKKPDGGDDEDEEEEGDKEAVADEDLPQLVETDVEKELWAQIGIMHDDLHGGDNGDEEDMFEGLDDDEIQEINSARARRRKAAYERVIAAGGANSLILSNYAQLLYEFDKDIKRAEMYFKQAVRAEPADGEAMRRYAIFLWHVRGDMAKAEDMFTEAIDEEPQSSHIRSSYAWFLWMTGGVETCLIDNSKNNNGDDAE